MTLISKAAGALGLITSIKDIHNNAVIYSKKEIAKASADTFISNSLANQRTNRLSTKDTQRKKWLSIRNFWQYPSETIASIRGYAYGLCNGVVNYIPQLILSGLAIGVNKNHKVLANVCAAALAVIEGIDFVSNTLSWGQKNDYLKVK